MKTIITIIIILFTSITYAGDKFTKISASGSELPDSATEWSCVKQNATGLIWEVKTDDGGFRDKEWTYSHYDSKQKYGGYEGVANRGSCENNSDCDTQKYTQRVNGQRLCGYNNWRLPSYEELKEQLKSMHPSFIEEYAYFFSDIDINLKPPSFYRYAPNAEVSQLYFYDANSNIDYLNDVHSHLYPTVKTQIGYYAVTPSGLFTNVSYGGSHVRLVHASNLLSLSITQIHSDKLFTWAETQYPQYFTPSTKVSKTWVEYYFRYYPSTGNYLGVNTTKLDVHVLGNTFDGQVRIDTLKSLMDSAKLSPEIEKVSIGDIEGKCVTTGSLMWEVKTNDGSLHDKDNTYTWWDGGRFGMQDGGICTDSGGCDTTAYVASVNREGLCGFRNWRLPTSQDFLEIFIPGMPMFAEMMGPSDFGDWLFWMQTECAGCDNGISLLPFTSAGNGWAWWAWGYKKWMSYKSKLAIVLVRSVY